MCPTYVSFSHHHFVPVILSLKHGMESLQSFFPSLCPLLYPSPYLLRRGPSTCPGRRRSRIVLLTSSGSPVALSNVSHPGDPSVTRTLGLEDRYSNTLP